MNKENELKIKLFDIVQSANSSSQVRMINGYAVPEDKIEEFETLYSELRALEKEKEQKVSVDDIVQTARQEITNAPSNETMTNYNPETEAMLQREEQAKRPKFDINDLVQTARQEITDAPSNETMTNYNPETDALLQREEQARKPKINIDDLVQTARQEITNAPSNETMTNYNPETDRALEKEVVQQNQQVVIPPIIADDMVRNSTVAPQTFTIENPSQAMTVSQNVNTPVQQPQPVVEDEKGIPVNFAENGTYRWSKNHPDLKPDEPINVPPVNQTEQSQPVVGLIPQYAESQVKQPVVQPSAEVDMENPLAKVPTKITRNDAPAPNRFDSLMGLAPEQEKPTSHLDELVNTIYKEPKKSNFEGLADTIFKGQQQEQTFPGLEDESQVYSEAFQQAKLEKEEEMRRQQDNTYQEAQRRIVQEMHVAPQSLKDKLATHLANIAHKIATFVENIKNHKRPTKESKSVNEKTISNLEQIEFSEINDLLKLKAEIDTPEGKVLTDAEMEQKSVDIMKQWKHAKPGEDPVEAYQRISKDPNKVTVFLGTNTMPIEYQEELAIEPETIPQISATTNTGMYIPAENNHRIMMSIDRGVYDAVMAVRKEKKTEQEALNESQVRGR